MIPPTISPSLTGAAQSASPPPPNAQASDAAVLTSDFETFLKMLTAQARYQDPLEPIDSTEYAAQLAQFSTVEQQVKTNDLLRDLISSTATADFSGIANWIGRDALTAAPVAFSGRPLTLVPDIPKDADAATLVVRDAQDREIQRLPVPVSDATVEWAGVDEDGTPLPPGTYRFEIEVRNGDAVQAATPARAYQRIVEARLTDDQATLVLSGGVRVAATEVSGLRDPG